MNLAADIAMLDRTLFHALNGWLRSPIMDFVMPLITDLGLGHVQVAALLLAAYLAGRRAIGARPGLAGSWRAIASQRLWLLPSILAIVLTGAVVQGLKRMDRQRPTWFYVHEQKEGRALDVEVHTVRGRRPLRENGFPSGHTATTAALAVTLSRLLGTRRARLRTACAMWTLTALVGFSRIYMADHWPLDVAAGIILGAAGGLFVSTLALRKRAVEQARELAGVSSEGCEA